MAKVSRTAPILTVSVAAELANMHPQTVRQYDRLGLVVASRTRGGGRRYSLDDVDKLIEIQRLSQEEGINLSGIARIISLEDDVARLQKNQRKLEQQLEKMRILAEFMRDELERYQSRERRVFAASATGDVYMAERIEDLRKSLREVDREAAIENESHDLVLWEPPKGTVMKILYSEN
ncbi:MAG: MerR family transcriptional regulator [Arcanobacterium sp.]|nr:MerR family transcriptional regulator [Arcanobacterium sp.]